MSLKKLKKTELKKEFVGVTINKTALIFFSTSLIRLMLESFPKLKYVNFYTDDKKDDVLCIEVTKDIEAYKLHIQKSAKTHSLLYRAIKNGRYTYVKKIKNKFYFKNNE